MDQNNIRTIKPDTIVKVLNNSSGSVSLVTTNFLLNWEKPDVEKRITFEKLQEAFTYAGVDTLFLEGILLIRDQEVRELLSLPPLSEYDLDAEGITELLKEGSVDRLQEVVEYCSNPIFEKIIDMAINLPVTDMGKIGVIKKYSGIDIYDIIQDRNASGKVPNANDKANMPKRAPVK